MDDSTLIASSKFGIEDRLSITAEFYTLNNVQANSAKYVLLSSSSPSSQIIFDLLPSSLATTTSLSLSSLALNTSFQFLGVWFSLSASPQFVLKQSRSMIKDMAAFLSLLIQRCPSFKIGISSTNYAFFRKYYSFNYYTHTFGITEKSRTGCDYSVGFVIP
ncbi:hypothetical protein RIR_jg9949.t1 [Rhizophagus irregularis DAOM 181602=DAOM 197198]|uniref:Uncharacterized protein n=1 Tax=Rhizophagus irregularis (strain DAOM 197198w) TaxID=1432141 RepID=A0A015L090_RHIIW|nr:hypothetical protein RirG_130410 [Rhizophagus irregularis DAOM 197198w]GET54932.1 hypothetical protein RIR_jg9949.t1 [Rhizophagus irregularis DAOM 181602=DAOM 197198]